MLFAEAPDRSAANRSLWSSVVPTPIFFASFPILSPAFVTEYTNLKTPKAAADAAAPKIAKAFPAFFRPPLSADVFDLSASNLLPIFFVAVSASFESTPILTRSSAIVFVPLAIYPTPSRAFASAAFFQDASESEISRMSKSPSVSIVSWRAT